MHVKFANALSLCTAGSLGHMPATKKLRFARCVLVLKMCAKHACLTCSMVRQISFLRRLSLSLWKPTHFFSFLSFPCFSGLPVEVRDAYLAKAAAKVGGTAGAAASLALTSSTAASGGVKMSDVNRQYALTQAERAMADAENGSGSAVSLFAGSGGASAGLLPEAHAALQRIARTQPYYARNQAKLCSFFAKGECNRGDLCPFRHEMPRDKSDPLARQNLLHRYHGNNDVLAAKILGKAEAKSSAPPPLPPSDPSVKTLWISGIDERVGEEDLREILGAFGSTGKIRLAPAKGCAFVEMAGRTGAEAAVAALHYTGLSLGDLQLRVSWAKPKAKEGSGGGTMGGVHRQESQNNGGGGDPGPNNNSVAASTQQQEISVSTVEPEGAGSTQLLQEREKQQQPPPPPGIANWAAAAAAAFSSERL